MMDWTDEQAIKKEEGGTINKRRVAYELYGANRMTMIVGAIGGFVAFLLMVFPGGTINMGIGFTGILVLVVLSGMSINKMNYLTEKYKLGYKPIKPRQQRQQKPYKRF